MNSINTDIQASTGDPTEILSLISEVGFSHIQWIHHWNTDFMYSESETDYIKSVMDKKNLSMYETHASMGHEKVWYSTIEYQRKAGFELVENRMVFTKKLGGDVIVLHPYQTLDPELYEKQFESGVKTLKELYKVYEQTGVKIALENMRSEGTYALIQRYFDLFPADFLVYCWDTGHSNNIGVDVMDKTIALAKERLYAMHLNDNETIGIDEHKIPFDGTCDWERICKTIAHSPYPKSRPYTLELSMKHYDMSKTEFLEKSLMASKKITAMINKYT